MRSIVLLLFLLVSCNGKNGSGNFKEFSGNFKILRLPLSVNQQTVFRNWPDRDLIDTNLVSSFQLLNDLGETQYPLRHLRESKCSYIGRLEAPGYTALIYKTYSSLEGDPKLVLTTYTKEGKKQDQLIALQELKEDPEYKQNQVMQIKDSSRIEIKLLRQLKDSIPAINPAKEINVTMTGYQIQKDGKILKLHERTQEVKRL